MIETDVKKTEALPDYHVGSKNDFTPSEDVLRRLGEFLAMRLRKLKTLRDNSKWEKDKARAFDAYHMVPKKDRPLPFPGASNLSSPLSRIGVDAFHSNVMSSLFANGKQLLIKPVINQKAFASTARKAADYMTYVMNYEADSYMVVDDADKKAQMYGSGYLEPSYVKEEAWDTVEVTETKQEPAIDPSTGEVVLNETVETRTEKKKRTTFDGIRIQSIPIESIYKSPFIPTIKQAVKDDAVFKVFQTSLAKLKEGAKKQGDQPSFYIKKQVDQIEPLITTKMVSRLTDLEQSRAKYDGFFIDMLSVDERIDLAEGYLWYDIDGDGIKEQVRATFHPELGTVIRVTLGPCRIVEMVPRPIDGRGEGESIPKICEHLDDEWENFHNTRANAGQWENTTFGFYRAGGRLNPQQITIRPGHFYPVDNPQEVQFANIPRVGSSFFQEEGLILNYFERIFALDENIQGISSKGAQTATETIRVSSKASVRFANPFNRIVSAIDELLEHIWELNQECAPPMKEFYIVGEDGQPMFDRMEKYDYSAKLKFTVEVSSIFDQQLTRDTMLLAYRMFLVNPLVQQHPEVLWDLSQKSLTALNVGVELPKPPQAKTLSPFEEHEMAKRGEFVEPEVGEDTKFHYKTHLRQAQDPSFKEWPPEAQQWLIMHLDKTTILEKTLESANLNKSGMFSGNPMMPQPGLTANRNPTQMFNTMKVGESGKSAMQNTQNGGANVQGNLDQTFGNTVS